MGVRWTPRSYGRLRNSRCHPCRDPYQPGIQTGFLCRSQSDSQQCRHRFRSHRHTGTGTGERNQSRCTQLKYECRAATFSTDVPGSPGIALPHRSETEITPEECFSSITCRRCIPCKPICRCTLHGCGITCHHR